MIEASEILRQMRGAHNRSYVATRADLELLAAVFGDRLADPSPAYTLYGLPVHFDPSIPPAELHMHALGPDGELSITVIELAP